MAQKWPKMAFLPLEKLYMVFQNSPLTTFPYRNLGSFGVSVISDFDQDLPVLNVYFPVFGHNRGSEKRAWPITRKRKVGGLLNLDPYPII